VLHGSAWLVVAGSGRAGLGRARQGEEPLSRRIGLMVDCYGLARRGLARRGLVWLGTARRGMARMFLLLERV